MRSIEAELQAVSGTWELPSPITGESAADYVARVAKRAEEILPSIKDALASPFRSVRTEAQRIGRKLRRAVERALKVARETGSAMAESLEHTLQMLEQGGITVAESIGTSIGLLAVLAVLLLAPRGR
jgi:ElaB/YqjD/DUF883 family membrane-anchored ribosome-binding protein